MADTTALKNRIRAAIKANDNQEITGPVLQQALLDIVDELNGATETEASQRQNGDSTLQQSITAEKNRAEGVEQSLSQADTQLNNLITGIKNNIGNGYVYAGIATPSTVPVSGKVFYVALQAGTYTNFGGTAVTEGITILKYNGASWVKEQALFTDGGVFDISAYRATGGTLATYADLTAALGTNGKNIPQSLRKGGMSVKFVQSSDNKYVQYRLMADSFTTDTTRWAIADEGVYVENPEWLYVLLDKYNRILAGIKFDGSVEWAIGVPAPVKAYVDNAIAEIKNGTEGTKIDGINKIITFLSDFSTSDTLKNLLDTKVDKEEGKSLIDAEYAEGVRYIENPEFVYVKTDKEGRILWAIKTDGSVYYGAGVPPQVVNYIREKIKELSLEDIVTFLGNLIEDDKTLQELLNEKVDKVVGKGLIDAEFSNNVSYEENPEFATAEVDSEKKLLGGRKLNGIRFEKIGFETPLLLIGENQCYTHNDPENRETLIVDKDNKVVSFRDKNGVLHEKAGIKTTLLNARNLILSEEGVKNLIDLLRSKGLKDKNSWKNKNIWWCGTSIPAAGFWNVNNAFSYPCMVGEQLGAKVFNEAVGSSCARKLTHTNTIYDGISRRMANTIEDALRICADLWTIDDTNQTFTNGPRTLGITDLPDVNTYGDACRQRMLLLSNSYEIKLVSKYLISNPEENENYLREKFGNLYETLVSLHPTAYIYQADIDLFVIDHGHNDGPTPVPTKDVDSLDMTTFIGAINNYIRLIMKYKPHARIVFISDYDNIIPTAKTIEAQKQIATNWHIPFIDLREYLPFNINVKVKTRGYWATDGIWQEDGFIYDSTAADVAHAFSVNGNAYFPSYVGTTIQEIAEHINPQQDSNGVWWYEYEPRYIYIKDGLHPHTDKSGKCLKLYADVLASFINNIGNNII